MSPTASVLVGHRRRPADAEDKPREDGGRDGRGAATSPGTPGAPEAGRGRKDPPVELLEGAQSCPAWISDHWSTKLGKDEFSWSSAFPCVTLPSLPLSHFREGTETSQPPGEDPGDESTDTGKSGHSDAHHILEPRQTGGGVHIRGPDKPAGPSET